MYFFIFFFNDTATTEIYTLSLHDALPIYLIEDDQLVLVVHKILARIGEPGPVILVFKIQVDRSCLLANLQSESCLSSLARPQKDYCRRMAKQFIQTGREAARDHACNYRHLLHICIVMFESGWKHY